MLIDNVVVASHKTMHLEVWTESALLFTATVRYRQTYGSSVWGWVEECIEKLQYYSTVLLATT